MATDATPQTRSGATPSRLTGHLNHNARELLYGSVLAAAALTVVGVQSTRTSAVSLSIVLTLAAYSLAHLYAEVLGSRAQEPRAPILQRLRTAAGHEAAVLEGGLPVVLCFVVLRAAGLGVADSALAASWFTVALMAVIGYRIGRLTGATRFRSALEAAAAAGIGLLLIVLKTALY